MKVVYAPRAIRDLRDIAHYYRSVASKDIALGAAARIDHVINLVARQPHIAPEVHDRPGVGVILVGQYPYKIFYRTTADLIQILHIRHMSRRPL